MPTTPLWNVARDVGQLAWFSRQVFSLAGRWARDDATPQMARMLGTLSNQHAVLAARCVERLPTIVLADGTTRRPEEFVVHPSLDEEQALLSRADTTDPEVRGDVLTSALTCAQRHAVETRGGIDAVLDEPTAQLLDDLVARLGAHRLAVARAVSAAGP